MKERNHAKCCLWHFLQRYIWVEIHQCLRNAVKAQVSPREISRNSLLYHGKTESEDLTKKEFIVNSVAFLLESEKIPDTVLSQHYYLPFQEIRKTLKLHKY